jgi:hypothetical protein
MRVSDSFVFVINIGLYFIIMAVTFSKNDQIVINCAKRDNTCVCVCEMIFIHLSN